MRFREAPDLWGIPAEKCLRVPHISILHVDLSRGAWDGWHYAIADHRCVFVGNTISVFGPGRQILLDEFEDPATRAENPSGRIDLQENHRKVFECHRHRDHTARKVGRENHSEAGRPHRQADEKQASFAQHPYRSRSRCRYWSWDWCGLLASMRDKPKFYFLWLFFFLFQGPASGDIRSRRLRWRRRYRRFMANQRNHLSCPRTRLLTSHCALP